jgi:voltage-gated potassium channel Kch
MNSYKQFNSPDNFMIKRITYELFILIVSVYSLSIVAAYYLLPLSAPVDQVLSIMDILAALVFLGDFIFRLVESPHKVHYFVTGGFLDLLSATPGFLFLRLFRLPRMVITTRQMKRQTPQAVQDEARARLGESTLLFTVLVVLLVITLGAITVVAVESRSTNANITTGEEAVWWAIVTVSTVGYGDYFPVTNPGRALGALLMVVGVSLFSVLTSYIASIVISSRQSGKDELIQLRSDIADLKQMLAASQPSDPENQPDQKSSDPNKES